MEKGEMQQKQGFTIIEVVLVLAIAGLIFLMMFVALPALNRSQRDSRRRDDISILLRKVKDFQTNNRGALPTTPSGGVETGYESSASIDRNSWKGFYRDYLGGDFKDPNGDDSYVLNVTACTKGGQAGTACEKALDDSTAFPSKMMIFVGATCNDSKAVASNNPRKIAVQYRMEGGGIYCANT